MLDSAETENNSQGLSRRNFILSSIASAAYLTGLNKAIASQGSDKKVKIVIAGGGGAGIGIANRLAGALPNADIVIIDKKEQHVYWPGLTLVATGVWEKSSVLPGQSHEFFQHSNIKQMKQMVSEFKPETKHVITDDGEAVSYDYLVVTLGIEYNYDAIEGMDVNRIGERGLTSVYHSPDKAEACWDAIETYSKTGGNGIFTLPGTPIRCAGAPIKMTFLTLDRSKRNGGFDHANMNFYSSKGGVFGLPWYNDFILDRFKEDGMDVKLQSPLTAVDIDAQKATFSGPNGDFTADYDLLHVVPPMRAPKPLRESYLAWGEGSFAKGGWLDVNQYTLQHNRYPNIFGCGDSNGAPLGKTAATIKMSAPIVVSNLLSVINEQDPEAEFNGYTSCPLITKIGSAMLVEFDYKKELIPTFSFIDPKQESWFGWYMKEQLLKPTYLKMLEGKV